MSAFWNPSHLVLSAALVPAMAGGAGALDLSINQGNALSAANVNQRGNDQAQSVSVQNEGQNNGASNSQNSSRLVGTDSAASALAVPSPSTGDDTCIGCGNIGSPQTNVQIASPTSSADGGTGIIGDDNDGNAGAVDIVKGGGKGHNPPPGGGNNGGNVGNAFAGLSHNDQDRVKRGCERVEDRPELYDRETIELCALLRRLPVF